MNNNNKDHQGLAKDSAVSREDRMILALLQHPTIPKAAEALGIHQSTLWRRLKNPDFQEKLLRARREAFSQSLGRLQHGSSAAASTLFHIMMDAQSPANSRVRAAECIMKLSLTSLDREDLLVRVARLEKKKGEDDALQVGFQPTPHGQ